MLNTSGGVNEYLNWGLEWDEAFGLVLEIYATYADGSYDFLVLNVPDSWGVHNLRIEQSPADPAKWNTYYDGTWAVQNEPWPYAGSSCRCRTMVNNNGAGEEWASIGNINVFTSSRVWSLQTQSSWPNCYAVARSGYAIQFSPQFYNWTQFRPI